MSSMHIQFTLYSAFYSPLIATIQCGFLKEQGIDADWSVSKPGVSAIEALKDGSAQVVQSAPSQAITAAAAGRTPTEVHFAQINEMDGFFLTARAPDEAFEWRKLEGAEVVLFGGGQPLAMFKYACHKAGIDFDRIKAVNVGGAAAMDTAFREGQGDYVQQQGPYPQQLVAEGIGHIVAQVGLPIGRCAFSSLAATREWLSTDQAVAFTRAYRNARAYMNDTPAADIADALSECFNGIAKSTLTDCISTYQQLGCWTPHVEITREAYEATLDIYAYNQLIDRRPDYEEACALPPAAT